jgi:hypothetical protein
MELQEQFYILQDYSFHNFLVFWKQIELKKTDSNKINS